eukprot:170205-Hanusia_phi.AAC.1
MLGLPHTRPSSAPSSQSMTHGVHADCATFPSSCYALTSRCDLLTAHDRRQLAFPPPRGYRHETKGLSSTRYRATMEQIAWARGLRAVRQLRNLQVGLELQQEESRRRRLRERTTWPREE